MDIAKIIVAKYRDMLKIPSSAHRRRVYSLKKIGGN